MHLPLQVDGPKIMTTVYAGVPPSVDDTRREALTNRSESGSAAAPSALAKGIW